MDAESHAVGVVPGDGGGSRGGATGGSVGHSRAGELDKVPMARWMLLAEVAVVWLILLAVMVNVAIVYPFMFLPFGLPFIWYCRQHADLIHGSLPMAFFSFGFIPGMVMVWFAQTILFAIYHLLFLAFRVDTSPDNTEEERDDGYIVFWLCVAFLVFALVTEVAKFLIIKYARVLWPNALEKNGSVIMTVAGALGFSIMNNVILLAINASYHRWSLGITFVWAIYYSAVLDTAHCMTAYYIAIAVVRRDILGHDIGLCGVLAAPILARGAIVFVSTPIPAFMGSGAGAIITLLACDVVILGLLVLAIRKAQATLPRDHVQQGGYFQVLGRGVVDGSDDDSDGQDLDVKDSKGVERDPRFSIGAEEDDVESV